MNWAQGRWRDPAAVTARLLCVRALVRAPLFLYRRGVGWVFGDRLLMLEHLGRRSGEYRYVCLEVVDRPADSVVVVASGFGHRAQWFRNLEANGVARVSTGGLRSVPATVTFLDRDAANWCLERYRTRHPRAWEMLRGTIEKASGQSVDEIPLVALAMSENADV